MNNRKKAAAWLIALFIPAVFVFAVSLSGTEVSQNEKEQTEVVINQLSESKDEPTEAEEQTQKTEAEEQQSKEKAVEQTEEAKTESVQAAAEQPASDETARRITQPADRGSTRDDVYWLARIIHAEAQGEPFNGKVAVGNVILNRVNSSQFPDSIYGVIFDQQNGYTQFSPVIDGSIYNNPSAESIRAAEAALSGQRPVGDALYFLNPGKSQSLWITNNRQYMTAIGEHDFYY